MTNQTNPTPFRKPSPARKPSSWEQQPVTSDEWNYNAFHCTASNEHDHSQHVNIPRTYKFPPQLVAQMQQWILDDTTPYSSLADVMRDSVQHRLAYLADKHNRVDFQNANGFLALEARLEFQETMEKQMSASIKRIRKRAKKLLKRRDTVGLLTLWEEAEGVHVEAAYQREWDGALERVKAEVELWELNRSSGYEDY